jgi:hypothetical protein
MKWNILISNFYVQAIFAIKYILKPQLFEGIYFNDIPQVLLTEKWTHNCTYSCTGYLYSVFIRERTANHLANQIEESEACASQYAFRLYCSWWVVSRNFTLKSPFYSWGKSSIGYEAGWNPQLASMLWRRANFLPLLEIKSPFLGHWVHSLVNIPTDLFRPSLK